jgi:hypothetical protein
MNPAILSADDVQPYLLEFGGFDAPDQGVFEVGFSFKQTRGDKTWGGSKRGAAACVDALRLDSAHVEKVFHADFALGGAAGHRGEEGEVSTDERKLKTAGALQILTLSVLLDGGLDGDEVFGLDIFLFANAVLFPSTRVVGSDLDAFVSHVERADTSGQGDGMRSEGGFDRGSGSGSCGGGESGRRGGRGRSGSGSGSGSRIGMLSGSLGDFKRGLVECGSEGVGVEGVCVDFHVVCKS